MIRAKSERVDVTIVERTDGLETSRYVESRTIVRSNDSPHIRWLGSLRPIHFEDGKRVVYIDSRTIKPERPSWTSASPTDTDPLALDTPTYLRDLAERVMRIPVRYGTDQGDADRLYELARCLESAQWTDAWTVIARHVRKT